jgi:cystathionine beta-synthase
MRHESILDAIGNTPLVRLNRLTEGLECKLYAKLEMIGPGGSVKDRIGLSMIRGAEERGELKPGGTIIECTSGNTGMGLAIVACLKGYRAVFTINDKQSSEKIDMLKAMGAEVIVCPTAVEPSDSRHYVQVARKLHEEIPNSFLANQYDNPDNALAHYQTTGPEIWRDTEGKVTHFICGMGTCGTISGTGKYLKEQNPAVKVIGVDPKGSLFYDFFHRGTTTQAHVYRVEGIGEDFFPGVLDWGVIDDVVQVEDRQCFLTARKLAREEGVLAGGSAGGAVFAALQVARDLGPDDVVVVLLPDGGTRYLRKIYSDEWMRDNQFIEAQIGITCEDILQGKELKELVFAAPQHAALWALERMRSLDVSQMPAIEGGEVVGTVYADDLVELVVDGKDLGGLIVHEVMKPPLPVVGRHASLEEIVAFIPSQHEAVLVSGVDGSFDIITKHDLVRTVGDYAIAGRDVRHR